MSFRIRVRSSPSYPPRGEHAHRGVNMTQCSRVHKYRIKLGDLLLISKQNTAAEHKQQTAGYVSPPPHRRHRARSFPVPRGSTATGGRTSRLALSDGEKRARKGERMHVTEAHGVDAHTSLLKRFYPTLSPIASRIQPTVPSPPHTRIL